MDESRRLNASYERVPVLNASLEITNCTIQFHRYFHSLAEKLFLISGSRVSSLDFFFLFFLLRLINKNASYEFDRTFDIFSDLFYLEVSSVQFHVWKRIGELLFNAFDVSLFQEAINHFAMYFLNSYHLLVNGAMFESDLEISYNCSHESLNMKLMKYLSTIYLWSCYNYNYICNISCYFDIIYYCLLLSAFLIWK